jgi:2-Cys peroxiredoxin 5
MAAWGEAQGATDKVMMLADPDASFAKALGLDIEAGVLGGTRSKRYSMVVEDGVVSALNVEPDGFGISCSIAEELIG